MKGLVFIISCLLLTIFTSVSELKWDGCAVLSVAGIATTERDLAGSGVMDVQSDALYDDDAVTLLTTYDCENDVVPCRLNQWGQQMRVLTTRAQMRSQNFVSLVKKLTHSLSAYLTTLLNHTSQVYSSLQLFCWQYAADCYVFAYRQIII